MYTTHVLSLLTLSNVGRSLATNRSALHLLVKRIADKMSRRNAHGMTLIERHLFPSKMRMKSLKIYGKVAVTRLHGLEIGA